MHAYRLIYARVEKGYIMARKEIDKALFNKYCEMDDTDVIARKTGEIIASVFDYDFTEKVSGYCYCMDAPYYKIVKIKESNNTIKYVFWLKNVNHEISYFLGNDYMSLESCLNCISQTIALIGAYYNKYKLSDSKITALFTNEIARYLLDVAIDVNEKGVVGGLDYNTNETLDSEF